MVGGAEPDFSTSSGVLDYVNSITQAPAKVQQDVLASILQENARCEYLARQGLNGRTDLESFKSCVPISSYDTIKHDLARIANGENTEEAPILCTGRISHLTASSGTSGGEQKLFPKVESERSRVMLFSLVSRTLTDMSFPGVAQGKGLYFIFMRPGHKTKSGLVALSATSSLLLAAVSPKADDVKSTSPSLVYLTPEKDNQMLYCAWLCGLLQFEQVVRMGAAFASGFVRALHFLQTSWHQMCQDIRQGKLDVRIEDPEVRKVVEGRLGGPNEELANRIESICSHRSNWDGIIPELFPNTRLVEVVITGSMAAYLPLIRSYIGELQIVSMTYASSELFLGINMRPACDPERVAYTLLPSFAYFEFLPVSSHSVQSSDDTSPDTSELVDLANVKLGHVYEVLVTTYSGLYRYRMEDCLKVVGFYNNTPEFQFVERRNVILSVDTDKTTETELFAAVTAAGTLLAEQTDTRIAEYTSYADVSTTPGHYVVFLEFTNQEGLQSFGPVLESCSVQMEKLLNPIYRRNRKEGHIGPLKLKVVDKGSFAMLRAAAVARGASDNQYKTPRCFKLPSPAVELLNQRTVMEVGSGFTYDVLEL